MGWIALLPTIVPPLVKLAEKLMGPKTGDYKLAAVTQSVLVQLQAAQKAGKLNGGKIDKDFLISAVGDIVNTLIDENGQVIETSDHTPQECMRALMVWGGMAK